MNKIWLLISLCFISSIALSQYGDLFQRTNNLFCHDQNRKLKCYHDDDYLLNFIDNKLESFTTSDSIFNYSEREKQISIKTTNDSTIIISLTKEGTFITYNQNKWHIDTTTPYMLFEGDTVNTFHTFRYIGGIPITLDFLNSKINFISLSLKNHFFKLYIHDLGDLYRWDITDTIAGKFLTMLSGNKNNFNLIDIYNYKNKVGVRLSQRGKKDKFDRIQATLYPSYMQKIYVEDLIIYKKNGQVNIRKSNIPINICSCTSVRDW